MVTLIRTFNWGSSLRNENPELTRQLSFMYEAIAPAVNERVVKYVTDGIRKPHANPPASSQFNASFDISAIYVRTDTDEAWIMTSRADAENVTWTQFAP